jgi:hypothetical protein
MMNTGILHVASSLLLLPYGLLCVYGIKEKLQPDVSEAELGGEGQGTFVACGSIDCWLFLLEDSARVLCSKSLLVDSARLSRHFFRFYCGS